MEKQILALLLEYGKVGLAEKLNINYRTLMKKLGNPDLFTLKEINKINTLYDEYFRN